MKMDYRFFGFGLETVYGRGTEDEANRYLNYLNDCTEIALYSMELVELNGELTMDLEQVLAEIEDSEEAMVEVFNLTQHEPTEEQVEVVERSAELTKLIKHLLTFEVCPNREEILTRAKELASIAASQGATRALIGGAPYLMPELEKQLRFRRIIPLYSFSVRVTSEKVIGVELIKTSAFKHVGWIEGTVL
jgi:predicted nucleotidyltransferase